MKTLHRPGRTAPVPTTPSRTQVEELARPLSGPADLDSLLDQIGSSRCVLLGEASHGTPRKEGEVPETYPSGV